MALTLNHQQATVRPSTRTVAAARAYRSALRKSGTKRMSIRTAGGSGEIPLPGPVAELLGRMLEALGEGKAVSLITGDEELTTVAAAKRLGVSRPFVIAQIDAGRLPCRMVGTHRRIAAADCDAFAQRMQRSSATLQELADQGQKLGMGYR